MTTNPLAPILVPDEIDVFTLPRRSYEYLKGDRRFLELAPALLHAQAEAVKTGVRQAVRQDGPALLSGEPTYLVQAIGS